MISDKLLVSTQFRAYSFERVLFSVLNRVWLINWLVLNLTLTGNQSDVKDVFEKGSDEVPDRTTVNLHRIYYTMISCSHFSIGITAIMQ